MLASEEDKCKAVICDKAVVPAGVKNGAALNRNARDAAPPDAWMFPLAQRSIFRFEHASSKSTFAITQRELCRTVCESTRANGSCISSVHVQVCEVSCSLKVVDSIHKYSIHGRRATGTTSATGYSHLADAASTRLVGFALVAGPNLLIDCRLSTLGKLQATCGAARSSLEKGFMPLWIMAGQHSKCCCSIFTVALCCHKGQCTSKALHPSQQTRHGPAWQVIRKQQKVCKLGC